MIGFFFERGDTAYMLKYPIKYLSKFPEIAIVVSEIFSELCPKCCNLDLLVYGHSLSFELPTDKWNSAAGFMGQV